MSKRKFIDKATYLDKQSRLHQLVDTLPKVSLNPMEHNLRGLPQELPIVFLDQQTMSNFAEFVNDDIRTCKLINWGKPAVELSFFEKHKYYLKKEISFQDKCLYFDKKIKTLQKEIKQISQKQNLFFESTIEDKLNNFQKELNQICEIRLNIHAYQMVVSNYAKNYYYTELSYKYKTEKGYKNYNTHIIKGKEKGLNVVNVIFVDSEGISKSIANQQKKIDQYLTTFPLCYTEKFNVVYLKKNKDV